MSATTPNASFDAPTGDTPAWLTATETPVGPLRAPTLAAPAKRRGGVSRRDVAEVTAQLAIMTQSGVDIGTALGSLARQCQQPALAVVLNSVHEDVMGGVAVSDAMRKHPRVFDEAYSATVAAGEATGRMADVLTQLSELLRSELRTKRTLRGVMIYPVVLTVVSISVVTAMLVFVLPQFAGIFEDYEVPLPGVTKALIAVSEELRGRWWLWCPAAAAAVAGLVTLRTTEDGRRASDRLLMRVGPVRAVIQTIVVGRVCRLLGLMIDSGVPRREGLSLTRKAIRNTCFQDLIRELEDSVTNGRGLTATLEANPLFPPSATEMIGAAERSGKLGEVLRMVGGYFEEEGEVVIKQAASLLEPLITVVMGAVVAVIVLAVMLPVFDLSSITHR